MGQEPFGPTLPEAFEESWIEQLSTGTEQRNLTKGDRLDPCEIAFVRRPWRHGQGLT